MGAPRRSATSRTSDATPRTSSRTIQASLTCGWVSPRRSSGACVAAPFTWHTQYRSATQFTVAWRVLIGRLCFTRSVTCWSGVTVTGLTSVRRCYCCGSVSSRSTAPTRSRWRGAWMCRWRRFLPERAGRATPKRKIRSAAQRDAPAPATRWVADFRVQLHSRASGGTPPLAASTASLS